MLRQEVYADDAGPGATPTQIQRARTPYTVTEQNFTIRALQPRGGNRHAVFFTHAREAISYHYERNPADPRIQHALTLEVDARQRAEASRHRLRAPHDRSASSTRRGTCSRCPTPASTGLDRQPIKPSRPRRCSPTPRTASPTPIETADTHRNPLPCEALTFELTGYTPTGPAGRFQASDLVEPDPGAAGRLRHKFTDRGRLRGRGHRQPVPPPDRVAAHALPPRRSDRAAAARRAAVARACPARATSSPSRPGC